MEREKEDWKGISIHAPLAGCDGWKDKHDKVKKEISIHAPLAGCDGAV